MLIIIIYSVIVSCDSQPTNYDDCVLKYMPQAQTPIAARAIRRSCKDKFKTKNTTVKKQSLQKKISQKYQTVEVGKNGEIIYTPIDYDPFAEETEKPKSKKLIDPVFGDVNQ